MIFEYLDVTDTDKEDHRGSKLLCRGVRKISTVKAM
jgi:hypothetical protein